jgi:multisubunit Na+/H+ antiporter MnhB subunit
MNDPIYTEEDIPNLKKQLLKAILWLVVSAIVYFLLYALVYSLWDFFFNTEIESFYWKQTIPKLKGLLTIILVLFFLALAIIPCGIIIYIRELFDLIYWHKIKHYLVKWGVILED